MEVQRRFCDARKTISKFSFVDLIGDEKLIEMQETDLIEYLITKYGIDKNDAEKLRDFASKSEHFTFYSEIEQRDDLI